MTLIDAFLHNPVKVSVGVLLVVLFGVIGLLRMPMQLTPEVQIPTITIETRWPGASPQEVERETRSRAGGSAQERRRRGQNRARNVWTPSGSLRSSSRSARTCRKRY